MQMRSCVASATTTALLVLTAGPGRAEQNRPVGASHLSAGEVVTILALPAGSSPEGVALGPNGNIFVGSGFPAGGFIRSEILRIAPDGIVTPFATLDTAVSTDAPGLLGLAAAPAGLVYAALASLNPSTHGVWRVDRDGTRMVRVSGSEQIPFPNALVFGADGALYITDSTGAIWRTGRDGVAREWIRHALLAPADPNHPILPPVGANGIAFFPPDNLYVANTQRGLIARIVIGLDGTAGPLDVIAEDFPLLTIDGIAVNVLGDIHGVVAGFALLGTDPLIRVEPHTGTITATPTMPGSFDVPLSMAFAAGPWERTAVFVTNGALPIGVAGPGPGLVQAEVGVPGFR